LRKKIAASSDDEESTSDSSDDESPRGISYRTPFFTQVYVEIFTTDHKNYVYTTMYSRYSAYENTYTFILSSAGSR